MADQFVTRDPDYKDLDLDFFKNPTTKDVMKKVGAEAIKRSIRNLVFTNFYEKPFHPEIGSDVRRMLFDNIDSPLVQIYLQDAIRDLINNFERRVRLTSVIVDEDYDNNGFNVQMEYIILNRNIEVTSTLFLERIR